MSSAAKKQAGRADERTDLTRRAMFARGWLMRRRQTVPKTRQTGNLQVQEQIGVGTEKKKEYEKSIKAHRKTQKACTHTNSKVQTTQ